MVCHDVSLQNSPHHTLCIQVLVGLSTGPSINQGTKFIASYNSLSHLSVSGRRFTVVALLTPVRVPTRCLFICPRRPSHPNALLCSRILCKNSSTKIEQKALKLAHGQLFKKVFCRSIAQQTSFWEDSGVSPTTAESENLTRSKLQEIPPRQLYSFS